MDREPDSSATWKALADPTRRRILDLLRERPRITGEIASHFEMSRIAVMRHLEVLAAAELVTSRKRGRERWHYLNAVPLQRIHERWMDVESAAWASRLLRLGRRATRMSTDRPAIDTAFDVSIDSTTAEVFAALTEDTGGWWGPPYVGAAARSLTLEPRLGGLLLEGWDEGGAVIATVTRWSKDRLLEMSGPFHLGLAVAIASFDLSAAGTATTLRFSFRAFGAVEAQMAEVLAGGWRELIAHRLKALVESGTRLGIAPDPPRRR